MRTGQLSVVVAACTRRRPEMLARLLESWTQLKTPENTVVRFLIVENDETPLSQSTVADFEAAFPDGSLYYAHEKEPGIPFARNRSAKEAIGLGADLLAFLDDDEVCASDWLVRLIAGYRGSEAVLLGAPLRATRPDEDLTPAEERMLRLVTARYAAKENRAARLASLDATPGVTIVTNNWLGETALFAEHGIWFDETMRMTGGTDAKFYADVRRKGLSTGWVKDAIVSETIPRERLSFRYQMDRSRDQSNTNFRRKIDGNGWARASVLVSVPLKLVSAAALAIALPFNGGTSLLKLARTLGWVKGRLGALTGKRSTLYAQTTGK